MVTWRQLRPWHAAKFLCFGGLGRLSPASAVAVARRAHGLRCRKPLPRRIVKVCGAGFLAQVSCGAAPGLESMGMLRLRVGRCERIRCVGLWQEMAPVSAER